jgi:hypothetical protein
MNIFNKTKILVGTIKIDDLTLQPFDKKIISFLSKLSKNILDNNNAKKFTDVVTFAFFCREKNLINLSKNYNDLNIRKGLGLSFHITPSNIPTNFAYSLMFGLLSGNSNIVRVPSKDFPQIKLISTEIKKTLKKFPKLKNFIKIIRYSKNEDFTKNISLISDARLVWGGNKTIKEAKTFTTKPNNRDLYFADKNSFCIINYDKFKELDNSEIKLLASNFYNDTYLVDQNACSSPHVIFWLSKKKIEKKIKDKFWLYLNDLVKKKYDPNFSASFFKYERSVDDYLNKKDIKIIKNSNIYRVQFKKNNQNIDSMKAKWGYFYETDIKNINEIFKFSNESTQTLSYFGFDRKYLQDLILKKSYKGIDRVVKIGQALSVSLYWDGYDIISNLTKVKDVR